MVNLLVRRDGAVYLTMREDDSGKYHDEPIGSIPNYDMRTKAYPLDSTRPNM